MEKIYTRFFERIFQSKADASKFYIVSTKPETTIQDLKSIWIGDRVDLPAGYHHGKDLSYGVMKGKYDFDAHDDRDYAYEIVLKNSNTLDLTNQKAYDYLTRNLLPKIDKFEVYAKKAFKKNLGDDYFQAGINVLKNATTVDEKVMEEMRNKASFNSSYLVDTLLSYIFETEPSYSAIIHNYLHPRGSSTFILRFDAITDLILVDEEYKYDSEDPRNLQHHPNQLSQAAFKALENYMSAVGKDIPKQYWPELEKYKPQQKIVVYRGMGWRPEQLFRLKSFKGYPFVKGGQIQLSTTGASSWSTNAVIAEQFAEGTGPLYIVIKYEVNPENVVVDTRLIDPVQRKKLYQAYQREIILKPGKYNVTVETIGEEENDDLQTGWNNYDPKEWKKLNDAFQSFAKWLTTELRLPKIGYTHKNQKIFSDWAVEYPTIKINYGKHSYGVVETRLDKKEGLILNFMNWGTSNRTQKSSFQKMKFKNILELEDLLLNKKEDLLAKIIEVFQ